MARFLSGLFGSQKQTQPPAASLRVNTSLQGTPVAVLLAGQNRLAGNIIDYFNFNSQSMQQSGGGGKGGVFSGGSGKGQTSGYQYYVSVIYAICEGPVASIVDVLSSGSRVGAGYGNGEFFVGNYAQTPWGYSAAQEPDRALGYRGIAYEAYPNLNLGSSATLPNLNFELLAANNGFLPGQPDGDPAEAFTTFLTNPYWGLGFPAARIGTLSDSAASWQAYCKALGIAVSPVLASATQASSFANDLLTGTNSDACWQDGLLTVVPYGDTAITAGSVSPLAEPHLIPAVEPNAIYPTIMVGNVGTFVADLGVTYEDGTKLVAVMDTQPGTGQYVMASPGVYLFSPGEVGTQINIAYTWAATASYLPDIEPVYDFTLDDYLPNQGTIGQGVAVGNSPLIVVRKPRDQMLNVVKVEYLDRNADYNPVDIERKDSASIVAFKRLRPSDVKQLHFFCLASSAVQSAMLMLVRQQIARTFQWTCGRHFILILALMKIATVSDPGQNIFRQPVRLKEIQENTDGTLTVTAEEFLGTATAPAYGTEAPAGAALSYNADPGAINGPVIFEPTDELSNALVPGGGLVIACAVSGQNPALWGGCNVWASYEQNGPYQNVGTIFGAARMGMLSAPLASVAVNPTGQTIDTADTLSVDLTESGGVLASGTQADARSLNTRCYVGPALGPGQGEIVAYANASLTATAKYDLNYLVRGAYGTEDNITTWAAGTPFVRLDQGVLAVPYDQSRIGAKLYLKFQSFNIWRGGTQDLSTLAPYAYGITGSALTSPLPAVANVRLAATDLFQEIWWDDVSDFRNGIRYRIFRGDTYAGAQQVGDNAHAPFKAFGPGTYWIVAYCQPVAGLIVYSEAPVSISIAGNMIVQNLVFSSDQQAAGWPGLFSNGVGRDGGNIRLGGSADILSATNILSIPDVLNYGGIIASGTYEVRPQDHVDVGYLANCYVNASLKATGAPVGQNILDIADFLNAPDVLGSASTPFITAKIQIATAQSADAGDLYGASDLYAISPDLYDYGVAWSDWQDFVPGVYKAWKVKFRVMLDSIDPNTECVVLAFSYQVSVPARIDHYVGQTVPTAGLSIVFQPDNASGPSPFNGGPPSGTANQALPYVQFTWVGQAGVTPIVDTLTLAGLTFHFVDAANNPVQVNSCNVTVEGF